MFVVGDQMAVSHFILRLTNKFSGPPPSDKSQQINGGGSTATRVRPGIVYTISSGIIMSELAHFCIFFTVTFRDSEPWPVAVMEFTCP